MPMPKVARIGAGIAIALVFLGSAWAFAHDEGAAASQTTDDAHVQADFSTVAPKVAGLIGQVLVEDNEKVRRGQLLALIDDRDFRVSLAVAEAELKSAQARAVGLRAALHRQSSLIAQAGAAVDADLAAVELARANANRYSDLASDGSASMQEQQESASRLQSDEADHRRDMAAHAAARQQMPMLAADVAEADAAIDRARAAVDAARLALSYTRIVAPVDGVIGRRSVRVGNYVQTGAPLLAIVPLSQVYVEANFRETQMRRIRPGQTVTIKVDTLPDIALKGRVESIAPASGVTFAAIGADNATGNFTKIVQRLSTRITIDPDQPDAGALRVGMSVVPTIVTGS